jgi:16S rRNA processing protein RimM
MRNDLIQVGVIVRAHGTGGEVILNPKFDVATVYTAQDVFYLLRGRDAVPARAEKVRLVQKGDQLSFFLKFEHITNRTEAESLRGTEVLLPESQIPDDINDTDEDLIGYEVLDSSGTLVGHVVQVIENPAHPLLQVKDDDGVFLVPLVDAYILGIDDEEGIIVVDNISELKSVS